jgi:hypothetical protein
MVAQEAQRTEEALAGMTPAERARLKELNAATEQHEASKSKHLRKSMQLYGSGVRNSIMGRGRGGARTSGGRGGRAPHVPLGLNEM